MNHIARFMSLLFEALIQCSTECALEKYDEIKIGKYISNEDDDDDDGDDDDGVSQIMNNTFENHHSKLELLNIFVGEYFEFEFGNMRSICPSVHVA